MAIKIDDLANEIANQIALYTTAVEEEVEAAKEEVSKKTVNELKNSSPELSGDYRKGWTRKKEGDAIIIHNKTDYQLTHLLEYGHVNRDGGRTPAKVHIRPAEEKAVQEYLDRVERTIKA